MSTKQKPYKRATIAFIRGAVLLAAFAGVIVLAVVSRPQPALIRLANFTKQDRPDKDTITTVIVTASDNAEAPEIFQATKSTAEEALSAAISRAEQSSKYSQYEYFRIDIAYGPAAANPAAITDNFPALSTYSYFISPTTDPAKLSYEDSPTARDLINYNSHYLASQVTSDGRFVYARDLKTGKEVEDAGYSMTVHAAAVSALIRAYSVIGDPYLLTNAESALEFLTGFAITKEDDSDIAYIESADATTIDLGSTAYTAIALADYHDITGSTRYDNLLAGLVSGIKSMYRTDSDCQLYYSRLDLELNPIEETAESYHNYTPEAVLATIRAAKSLDRSDYLDIAAPILVDMLDRGYTSATYWFTRAVLEYQSAGTKSDQISAEDAARLAEISTPESRSLSDISASIILPWAAIYSDSPRATVYAIAHSSDDYTSYLDDNQSAIIELYDLLDTSAE